MNIALIIVIPLLLAFISIVFKKLAQLFLILSLITNITILLLSEYGNVIIGGFEAPYGISLVFTAYSFVVLLAVNILFLFSVVVSRSKSYKYSSILLVSLAGLNGLVLTGDLFNLFVFIEISAISAYIITSSNKKDVHTFNYIVQGSVGSVLYLLGLIMLYNMFGTLNLEYMSESIILVSNTSNLVLPLLLMFIGLGVEVKLLPLNNWVKGILGQSNQLTSTLLGSVYIIAFGFVVGKLFNTIFKVTETLGLLIMVLLIATIVVGELAAFSSKKVRELLAYSSIANAGLVMLMFFVGFVDLALIYLIISGFTKFVLFSIITEAILVNKDDDISSLTGLFKNNYVVGTIFTIAVLSMLGLPLFVGFIIKFFIIANLLSVGGIIITSVVLLATVIEGIYMVNLLIKLWFGNKDHSIIFDRLTVFITALIAATIVISGVHMYLFDYVITLLSNSSLLGG